MDEPINLGGASLTIATLELIVRTLEREGEVHVVGCAKAICGGASSTLMTFGAYLAEDARQFVEEKKADGSQS